MGRERREEVEEGTQVTILAPIVRQKKGTYGQLFADLNAEGFSRVRVNGEIRRTDETIDLDRYKKHDIDLVMDRLDPALDRGQAGGGGGKCPGQGGGAGHSPLGRS